jgi:hypothetical protein
MGKGSAFIQFRIFYLHVFFLKPERLKYIRLILLQILCGTLFLENSNMVMAQTFEFMFTNVLFIWKPLNKSSDQNHNFFPELQCF